jgi:hypothetical protein
VRILPSRLRGRDDGAYAILYAIIIVLMVSLTGLVVDIGNARVDRTSNRSASDFGAIAGAAKLGLGGSNPIQGCQQAVDYAKESLGGAVAVTPTPLTDKDCATAFAGSVTTLCTAGVTKTAIQTVTIDGKKKVIQVSWPVPDVSPLLTQPDMERRASNASQQTQQSVASDGTPCLRLAVQILQTRTFLFGKGAKTTESKSVALAVPRPGPGEIAAPLVILDQHACQALRAAGGGGGPGLSGGVEVTATAPFVDDNGVTQRNPGVIAVDSDGTQGNGENGLSCNGGGTTISVSNNSHVWALDGTQTPGYITDYAITVNNLAAAYSGNTTGCPVSGFWTPPVTGPPPNLCRIPQLGDRVTDRPWQNRYNCTSTDARYSKYNVLPLACTDPAPPKPAYPTPRDYVDQWERFATGNVPKGTWGCTGVGAPAGCTAAGPANTFRITGGACTITSDTTFNGDVYADCDDLKIRSTARVAILGSLVTKAAATKTDYSVGNVSLDNSACLLLGDTIASGHCTSLPPPVDAASPGADTHSSYIGGGFDLSSGTAFVNNKAMVFLRGKLDSNATGVVSWVGPYGANCVPAASVATPPSPDCFNSLSLWSPYPGTNVGAEQDFITGGALLNIDGTLFMPYAAFNYSGQATNLQTRAQLVTRILNLTGGSVLRMTPDASRSTDIPSGAGQLIR